MRMIMGPLQIFIGNKEYMYVFDRMAERGQFTKKRRRMSDSKVLFEDIIVIVVLEYQVISIEMMKKIGDPRTRLPEMVNGKVNLIIQIQSFCLVKTNC